MSSFVVNVLWQLTYLILIITHWRRHSEFSLHMRKLGLKREDDLTRVMELEEARARIQTHVLPTPKLSQFPAKSYQTVWRKKKER